MIGIRDAIVGHAGSTPLSFDLDAVHCIVSRAFMLVIWRGPRLVGYIGTSRSGTVINHRSKSHRSLAHRDRRFINIHSLDNRWTANTKFSHRDNSRANRKRLTQKRLMNRMSQQLENTKWLIRQLRTLGYTQHRRSFHCLVSRSGQWFLSNV
jgi:hypothetical protein